MTEPANKGNDLFTLWTRISAAIRECVNSGGSVELEDEEKRHIAKLIFDLIESVYSCKVKRGVRTKDMELWERTAAELRAKWSSEENV